jgi:hypothetical protein
MIVRNITAVIALLLIGAGLALADPSAETAAVEAARADGALTLDAYLGQVRSK